MIELTTRAGQPWLSTGTAGYAVPTPVVVEHWDDGRCTAYEVGYAGFDGTTGSARVPVGDDCVIVVRDRWQVSADTVTIERVATVEGRAGGGFLTEFGIPLPAAGLADLRLFVPGMLYGDTERVNPYAIGAAEALSRPGAEVRLREDRTPAPLVAVHLPDGNTIALLHDDPDGSTSADDAADTDADRVLIDPAVRVGALRLSQPSGGVRLGFTFPGTEGEVTYRGDTFPDGQLRQWRRRYHPLRPGHTQQYRLAVRLGAETFPELLRRSWRWAWGRLRPVVHVQDIRSARNALFDQLAGTVLEIGPRAGIPLFLSAVTGKPEPEHWYRDYDALMGFTGRNTDCGWYLIRESTRTEPERGREFYRLGTRILDSFAALPASPPAGEGFDIRTGAPISASPHQQRNDTMHLRGLAEGMKSMIRAWRAEQARGVAHDDWLTWCRDLGDWLLRHQRADGSLPRSWLLASDTVVSVSGHSSYVVIAPLVELYRATGDTRFERAARAAADYCLGHGHRESVYVGGTLDNPDVVDKEAGTLALEGYLLLYEDTGEPVWLDAARDAADYAETWIYLWDVPMPPGPESQRGWKNGVPTTGVQLIATGHSLVDQYMAADAASYARLARYTGDPHYTDVARILLHNTKVMLALPERPYDLAGPGWQQEHWSLAPSRGNGLHRGWLPWVTCNHIEGLASLEDFSPQLYATLTGDQADASPITREASSG